MWGLTGEYCNLSLSGGVSIELLLVENPDIQTFSR